VGVADSAILSAKLVKDSTLKIYPGAPRGICITLAEKVNANPLAFL
jgi:non-heme chloroperoxidase